MRPEQSQALAEFLDHVEVVVTVHGYGREGMWTTLLVGGENRTLAGHVALDLRPALPDYTIATDLDEIRRPCVGRTPITPRYSAPRRSVELELPPRVRGRSPIWKDWEGPGLVPHTVSLIEGLAAAATTWP